MFKVYHFGKLTSTNDKAKSYPEGSVIVADEQTKGRGRFKRKWSSAKGGLYMSIVLNPLDQPGYLTFIAVISLQRAIEKEFGLKTKLKWPNDVLYDDKKLCGILAESIFFDDSNKMVVGIGLNVNNKVPISLSKKAISLKSITKKGINRGKLVKSILKEFKSLYLFYKNKNYKKILSLWKKLSDTIGRKIKAVTQHGTYIGKAVDVDKDCSLILRLKNGSKKRIIEGDISALD
ncbi:biotin--[acetyl-CoA-carboxylase] ligase [Candidatus Woesearchaeota archaeon]|nr:biotin--[acetyl-CoA-carboxylase] ligase [Candidatus Woesearchaeota archaeon]